MYEKYSIMNIKSQAQKVLLETITGVRYCFGLSGPYEFFIIEEKFQYADW